ncbi:hypothetical protein [Chamaesiphon sp. VAR_48_metabat_403]|nr:hypothetical protein [Chamaesiphon sp. VAR_48_metabat_403]
MTILILRGYANGKDRIVNSGLFPIFSGCQNMCGSLLWRYGAS